MYTYVYIWRRIIWIQKGAMIRSQQHSRLCFDSVVTNVSPREGSQAPRAEEPPHTSHSYPDITSRQTGTAEHLAQSSGMVATNADLQVLTTQLLTPAFPLLNLPIEHIEKGPLASKCSRLVRLRDSIVG